MTKQLVIMPLQRCVRAEMLDGCGISQALIS